MKKKQALAPITAEEMATARCEQIRELTNQINKLEDELLGLKSEQIFYMKSEGLKSDNGFSIVETAGKQKIGGLTGKALAVAKERLLSLIADVYVKKGLDEAKITACFDSDHALVGQFTITGLSIEKSEATYSLRSAKEA